jgi:hypothetical protein
MKYYGGSLFPCHVSGRKYARLPALLTAKRCWRFNTRRLCCFVMRMSAGRGKWVRCAYPFGLRVLAESWQLNAVALISVRFILALDKACGFGMYISYESCMCIHCYNVSLMFSFINIKIHSYESYFSPFRVSMIL